MDESLQIDVRARERLPHLEPFALQQLLHQPRLERAMRPPGDPGQSAQVLQKALGHRRWRRGLDRVRLQINLRAVHDKFAGTLRPGLPGGVQHAHFPRRRCNLRQRRRQLLGCLRVGTS